MSVGNHTFYQLQLFTKEEPFQSFSVTVSLDYYLPLSECSISLQAILSNKGKALFIISHVNIKSCLSSFSSST